MELTSDVEEVIAEIYNPLKTKYVDGFKRYVAVGSKVSPEFIEVSNATEFIKVYRKYRESGYMGLLIGVFSNPFQMVFVDRVYFDCEKPETAREIYGVLVEEYNIKPLIIFTGGRGYHLVVFVRGPSFKDYRTFLFLQFLRLSIFKKLYEKHITGLDVYYGAESITYHVVPYTLKSRTNKWSCICDENFKCLKPKDALDEIREAAKNPVSIRLYYYLHEKFFSSE